MKQKLTLTVRKKAVDNARRYSKKTGKSISQIFEELFETSELGVVETESQKSAKRLLEKLDSSGSIETLDDKSLLKEYVAGKFA